MLQRENLSKCKTIFEHIPHATSTLKWKNTFRDSVCFAWQRSHKPCVGHANMIWFCMWFLTLSSPHTCFRLGVREWLLVYTCVSAWKPQGSWTNTRVCYPCIAVTLVCSGIPTAGCLFIYITVQRLSQHANFILKYSDELMCVWINVTFWHWCVYMWSGLYHLGHFLSVLIVFPHWRAFIVKFSIQTTYVYTPILHVGNIKRRKS